MCMANRYLTIVLTVIALELLWLSAWGTARPVLAQSEPTRVVITGIRLDAGDSGRLPVTVRGTVTITPAGPVKVEVDQPLLVKSAPMTPSLRPGQ
jgi:hypothetical protein